MADLYYSNRNLAYTYHVSVATVYNWIDAAKNGKLDLELYEHGDKFYVRKSANNIAALARLVEARKKYRPHTTVKEITPRSEFYKVYTEGEIYDIVINLEKYREIDCDYNYFESGAENWDNYVRRLAEEETRNSYTSTVELLEMSFGYLDKFLESYDKVNIVDIGVGNALPVRGLVDHLLKQSKLGRYIALDISREMLNIARANIDEWYGGRVTFEDYELDIKHDRFSHILAEDYLKNEKVANIVLFLGGTPNNFREPDKAFQAIYDSLRKHDIFIRTSKLDTKASRNFVDFSASSEDGSSVDPIVRFIFDLLNIDQSLYEIQRGFDESTRQRYLQIKLTSALKMTFNFPVGKQVLEFNKGDKILFWRAWHMTPHDILEQLERNGFYMLNTSQTPDCQYMLTISRIKDA